MRPVASPASGDRRLTQQSEQETFSERFRKPNLTAMCASDNVKHGSSSKDQEQASSNVVCGALADIVGQQGPPGNCNPCGKAVASHRTHHHTCMHKDNDESACEQA
jgi:hypothetical protein